MVGGGAWRSAPAPQALTIAVLRTRAQHPRTRPAAVLHRHAFPGFGGLSGLSLAGDLPALPPCAPPNPFGGFDGHGCLPAPPFGVFPGLPFGSPPPLPLPLTDIPGILTARCNPGRTAPGRPGFLLARNHCIVALCPDNALRPGHLSCM